MGSIWLFHSSDIYPYSTCPAALATKLLPLLVSFKNTVFKSGIQYGDNSTLERQTLPSTPRVQTADGRLSLAAQRPGGVGGVGGGSLCTPTCSRRLGASGDADQRFSFITPRVIAPHSGFLRLLSAAVLQAPPWASVSQSAFTASERTRPHRRLSLFQARRTWWWRSRGRRRRTGASDLCPLTPPHPATPRPIPFTRRTPSAADELRRGEGRGGGGGSCVLLPPRPPRPCATHQSKLTHRHLRGTQELRRGVGKKPSKQGSWWKIADCVDEYQMSFLSPFFRSGVFLLGRGGVLCISVHVETLGNVLC